MLVKYYEEVSGIVAALLCHEESQLRTSHCLEENGKLKGTCIPNFVGELRCNSIPM